VLALCGLPGTGKSTLARALAPALDAAHLDKDVLRAALFAPGQIEHSREQDDLCCRLLYEVAAWLLRTGRRRAVVLDGRTYLRAGQLDPVRALARDGGARLALVECTCAPELARARLQQDVAQGAHPAGDRDPALHARLAAEAVPLPAGRLRLATDDATPETLAARVLAWLADREPPSTDPAG
jgi:predicted kinase